jgi:hypothetical protein
MSYLTMLGRHEMISRLSPRALSVLGFLFLLSYGGLPGPHAAAGSTATAGANYTPALCYLVANFVSAIVPGAVSLHLKVTFSWPPECHGPSNDLLAKNPHEYMNQVKALRIDSANKIKQLGYAKLPKAVDISVGPGCPKNWLSSGSAELHQSDFDLELYQSGESIDGAIVQNHMVFSAPGDGAADLGFEPLYGDWSGSMAVLQNNGASCQISFHAR